MTESLLPIVVSEVFGLLLLTMAGIYGYGKLNERVNHLERNERMRAIENQVKELHEDHRALETKVDENRRLLNRVVGILSIVHPDAAGGLD
ncbi:MAG: hypothetical protein OXP73_01970 [Chloroflexota bacterium]|nr:hypothetical protein [Chloroflexota bacterium]